MKILTLVSRILLGLGFTVFGLNILHPFMPQPPLEPGSLVAQFMAVMWPTHWMAVTGLFQLVGGVMVLSGRLAPIGLVLLAPVLVNILCFHAFLDGGHGIAPGMVFSALEIFLVYAYRSHFSGIFTMHAHPSFKSPKKSK